ncbi:Lipid transfer protein [Quillaja saponaria]|uniref:Lipid transfer protein n=1 Tax=Quillaja saponaria TaxID=32244 RepID=A0AAD7PJI8_QUISA|nr:Lipid transfer protein [Quillaja saponaria]
MPKVSGAGLADKCGAVFNKVAACLSFVTGKAAAPTKDCCTSTTEIRENEPECLCFIIQQIHNGNQQLKSLGVQEAKLLQLPSSCNLKNANVTDCPKLLGLPANSPDAAIFTNASSATPTSSTTTTPAAAGTSPTPKNNENRLGPQITALVPVLAALIFFAFPTGRKVVSSYIRKNKNKG